jgi:hypothetical protein
MLPLHQETRLINPQGIIGRVEVIIGIGPHLIAHALHIPVRATQHRLEGIRGGVTGVLR